VRTISVLRRLPPHWNCRPCDADLVYIATSHGHSPLLVGAPLTTNGKGVINEIPHS